MPAPSLTDLTFSVTDIDASAAFYRAIGCDVFEYDEPGYTRHFDAATSHTLIQLFPANQHRHATHSQIGIRVASIEAVADRLQGIGSNWTSPGPKRLATSDPDGNVIHITEAH